MAGSSQRASPAPFGLVLMDGAFKTSSRSFGLCPHEVHSLAHRTGNEVFLGIEVQVIGGKWSFQHLFTSSSALRLVKSVVLDIGFHVVLFEVFIVLLGAVAGVGGDLLWQLLVGLSEALEVGDQGGGIGRVGVKGVMEDVLVSGADLDVVAWLELTVFHVVFLHAHEGRIGISFGVGVTSIQDRFVPLVLG